MGLDLAFANESLIAHLIDPAIRNRSSHSSDRDDAILGTSINDRSARMNKPSDGSMVRDLAER